MDDGITTDERHAAVEKRTGTIIDTTSDHFRLVFHGFVFLGSSALGPRRRVETPTMMMVMIVRDWERMEGSLYEMRSRDQDRAV